MVTLKLLNNYINNENLTTNDLFVLALYSSLPNNAITNEYISKVSHLSDYQVRKTLNHLTELNLLNSRKENYTIKSKTTKPKTSKDKIVCLDTNEKFRSYSRYLKSKHWKNKKAQYYKMYKYKCDLCKKCFVWKPSLLNLHHRTYANIGNEKPTDLVLLCKNCHTKIHKNPKKYPNYFKN